MNKVILAMLVAVFVFVPDTEAFLGIGGGISLCLMCKLRGDHCPDLCNFGRSETEFDMADLNNDGKLSLEELETYLADVPLPDNLSVEDIFNELDTDGNGFLEMSDFDEPPTL